MALPKSPECVASEHKPLVFAINFSQTPETSCILDGSGTLLDEKEKLFSKKQPVSKMVVGPASKADDCIVLEDYKERESPQPAFTASTSLTECKAIRVLLHRAHLPASILIPQSPLTTAEEQTDILKAENKKLFSKFVEHCSALTQDCPEVLTFLQTKYTKASPDYLSSVEFRNTLEQCLTCVQTNRSKTFAFINELCIVLRNRAAKKRQILTRVESGSSSSSSLQSAFVMLKGKGKTTVKEDDEVEETGKPAAEKKEPSTTVLHENTEDNKKEQQEAEKNAKRSRKQTAYLENLLKVYHEEICRLQQAELSLDDLEAEDSLYVQEHKLKRKMMKIYEKLCELKGCNRLTGRAIEQKIPYTSTRYPEINSRIEHFINSPEVRIHPPDYQDILQLVLQANKHHNLCLSRKQLNQMALDAFRETGNSMQERRHLDLVYNFGSYLTDAYKPASDPALLDPSLKRKLQLNREVAISQLEVVFSKYAVKQDDIEEQERNNHLKIKDNKSKKGKGTKDMNGVEEDEEELEEEEEEEDYSSDPDIEEEIQASTQQNVPGDDGNEEDNGNGAEQAGDDTNREDQMGDFSGSTKDTEENPVISGHGHPVKTGETVCSFSHISEDPANFSSVVANGTLPPPGPRETRIRTRRSKEVTSNNSPISKHTVNRNSPSQSESTLYSDQNLSNGKLAEPQEPVRSSRRISAIVVANGTSPPLSPRAMRSQRRKRNREETSSDSPKSKHIIIDSDSPSWSEPMQTDDQHLSNGKLTEPKEAVNYTSYVSPVVADRTSLVPSSVETLQQSDTQPSSRKRRREETTSQDCQNSEYADCGTVHCLICHKPQSNISVHLSLVCMKTSTREKRAAECRKAKASSSMWVHANRTWYYSKICELVPHRPSRSAVIKDLLRRGFFIMDLPDDLDMDAEETSSVAMATTSTASTSGTVTDPSDSLEATSTHGLPEMSVVVPQRCQLKCRLGRPPGRQLAEAEASAEATVEACDVAMATASTASATSTASTSGTVTDPSDSLEANGSPEMSAVVPQRCRLGRPSGCRPAEAEASAVAFASPSKYRRLRNRSFQGNSKPPTKRFQMKEAGLYTKFPDDTNIIKDFKKYLVESMHKPYYRLEVDQVSKYLRYLQPSGDILTLDFVTKSAETTGYLQKLKCMGLSTKSLVSHTRSIIGFFEFLRTHPYLKQKDTQLRTMLATTEMMLRSLRHSDLQKDSKPSDKDCQEVLRLGKQDFMNSFNKLSSDTMLSVKEKTMYRYYLEAILILRYFQRPTTVTNLTVREWVNRTRAHGRVMIGTKSHRMTGRMIVEVTITQEEESWFQAYYKYIRPWHIGSSDCETFFVSAFGKANISTYSDLIRFHKMYKLDEARNRIVQRIVEAQAAEFLTETRKDFVADYLAQSTPVATKPYTVLTPQKPVATEMALENSSTEQTPQEEVLPSPSDSRQQAAAGFAAIIEKFPVTKEGRPPSPKQLIKAGIPVKRGYYDKWRFIQVKVREAYLLSHFTQRKPSVLSVARLIKKEGWKNNHPKLKAVVQKWKPTPKNTMDKTELVNNIKNQSWKGLTVKTFGDQKRVGVVATRHFAKGSIVCDYHGKIISAAKGRRLMKQSQVQANSLFFFKDLCVDFHTFPCECHPDVDTFSRRINRSSHKPNLKPVHYVLEADEQDVILLQAITDIGVDDELTL
ncbi:death domain-associated protein 6-like [Solea senegalensis]|uniref:Death domain-associated protein 6 n=1 Tax=Solea senegalensis TaxID=28829 RepID=A0AAV6R507_SOLSE|nr:death domain-associated protein 6-like [Solea senegalensis]